MPLNKDNLQKIIDELEETNSKEDAYFGIFKYGNSPDKSYIKGNKQGLELYAAKLLKASRDVNEAVADKEKALIPVDFHETWLDGETKIQYIEPSIRSREQVKAVPDSPVHFYNLDILRFIAALMIVFAHGYEGYTGWFQIPKAIQGHSSTSLNFAGEIIKTFHGHLGLGVDFFFIISGFLITYLLLKERDISGQIHIGKFYLRRILRIWPVYFFIVIIAKWWCVYLYEPLPDYWWTVTFLNNYQPIFSKSQFPFQHFWSVCIEEHFYIFWPLLLSLIPVKNLPKLFITIIAFSILFRIYTYYTAENWELQAAYNTLSKMDTLAIGSWIGWIYFKKPFEIRISLYIRVVVYSILLLYVCFITTFWENKFLQASFEKYILQSFLVFWFINYMFNKKALLVFKTKNIFHYFGKISYGLYMYHNILIIFIVKMIFWKLGLYSFGLYWVIFIGLTFIISILSYEIAEKPILKMKDKFSYIKTSR